VTLELDAGAQRLLRDLAPRVLGSLARRFGNFGDLEDAVQEALLAAAGQWPREGLPENPRAWLTSVAFRRLSDRARAEAARRHREALVVSLVPPEEQIVAAPDADGAGDRDDTLDLVFMCCHPALSPSSAVALTLRAVAGLTTAEIAKAYLVPEATMAQRISRAKGTIRGLPFETPSKEERRERLQSVTSVLYLIFNEGYTASAGPALHRPDLTVEALRLTRMLSELSDDEEVSGLLALMLLTDARRAARTGASGELVPLDEQDRSLWDRAMIGEGVSILERVLPRGAVGPYQIQAAIAAIHDEAASTEETDWAQILGLYGVLLRMGDNPMVVLNHAIAVAMVEGPAAGLERLRALESDPRIAEHHRLHAVRAHLLERHGDRDGAISHYRRAAALASSLPERSYLLLRAARLEEVSTRPRGG